MHDGEVFYVSGFPDFSCEKVAKYLEIWKICVLSLDAARQYTDYHLIINGLYC